MKIYSILCFTMLALCVYTPASTGLEFNSLFDITASRNNIKGYVINVLLNIYIMFIKT